MADEKFDRTTQDVGNIVALEHVNVRIPSQALATAFYSDRECLRPLDV